jgi:hypothetical protein
MSSVGFRAEPKIYGYGTGPDEWNQQWNQHYEYVSLKPAHMGRRKTGEVEREMVSSKGSRRYMDLCSHKMEKQWWLLLG